MLRLVLVACLNLIWGCATGPRTAPVADLKIEASEPSAPSKSAMRDTTAIRPSKNTKDTRPEIYRVKEGDTLYAVALDYGLDYRELASWNALSDPNRVTVGQILTLRNPRGAHEAIAESEPVVVESKPLAAGELPPGEPLPESAPWKTEPKAVKIPYSEEALARLQRGNVSSNTGTPESEIANKRVTKPPAKVPAPETAGGNEASFDAAKWLWPAQGEIASTFDGSHSKGISIAGRQGDPVMASASGKVVYAGKAIQAYGQLVIVKHSNEYLSVYAHNSRILVKEGQQVASGQKIAEMGERSPGQVGLHFEIRKQGQPVDPVRFLPSR